jgi:hydrogenase 3 maturation protease
MIDSTLLEAMLAGRTVIACVGNALRGDEGVGHLVAGEIAPSDRARVVDCGETPENYLGVIAAFRPQSVVVISAVDFGAAPGEICVLRRRDAGEFALSTLTPRLLIITDYIEAQCDAATYFVGIQPANLEFGSSVTQAVAGAGRALAQAINEMI